MSLISIIMPVYNSEMYVKEAIRSILDQTYKNFQLILVNDASTDRSSEICAEFNKIDARIKFVNHEKNLGICGARNTGLQVAEGEYIAFCDDDDYYYPELLELNYKLAKEKSADIIKFGRELIDVNSEGRIIRKKLSKIPKVLMFKQEEVLENYYYIKSLNVLTNIWEGLYKTEFLKKNNIRFDESMKFGGEDANFMLQCISKAEILVLNPKIFYLHYRRNSSSTSRKFSMNKVYSLIKNAELEKEIWDELSSGIFNEKSKIYEINNYIINIFLVQLFHKDAKLKTVEKINFLKQLRLNPIFAYTLSKDLWIEMLKGNPKQALFTLLYFNRKYYATYFLMILYNKFLGEKW